MFLRRGCARYRQDLSLMHDGCLPEKRVRQLEEHLKWCESCRVQRDLNRLLSSELVKSAAVVPSPDFDSKVVSALRMAQLQRPSTAHWRRFSLASAAAALVMTITLQYASLGERPDRPAAAPGASVHALPEDLLERYKLDRSSPLWYHRNPPVEQEKAPESERPGA